MRTLQEKYTGVISEAFSKAQFKRDAIMECPQWITHFNSFEEVVSILKNKGVLNEAFGEKEEWGDTSHQAAKGLEVKSLAKQLYLGFKEMGARVRLDANRKKSPIGAEWGEKGLDQIDVLIFVGDSPKGFMAVVDLIGDKAISFADKIKNDSKFSKFEFSKREIKTWENQKGIELQIRPKVSKKGAVSVTEAKKQEPKYSTAKPEDHISLDLIDTGIRFELDKKNGTLDCSADEYAKTKAKVIKNLTKDQLYYIKQDSEQLPAPKEQMEKVTLKESRERLKEGLRDIKHKVTSYANIKYPEISNNDIEDFLRLHAKEVLAGDDLETSFDNYIDHNFESMEERAYFDPYDELEEEIDATEKAASDKIGRGEEFTDDDAAAVANKAPKIKKDAVFTLMREDDHSATLKQRKALKEAVKGIIRNVLQS